MENKLTDSVKYLRGVGEKRGELFRKLGVDSIYSLLRFYPKSYVDYSQSTLIAQGVVGDICCVRGIVYRKQGEQRIRQGLSIFKVYVSDGHTNMIITIYNNKYGYEALELDHEYAFYGKLTGGISRFEMNSPTYVGTDSEHQIRAIYPLTEGFSNNMILSAQEQALKLWGDVLTDSIPVKIKEEENLCHLRYAYENIHFPKDMYALSVAKKRLVFEELLTLQLGLILLKRQNREKTTIKTNKTSITPFVDVLPFELTDSQKHAINDGVRDFLGSYPMNRLLQGDVGSGKTMVACALSYYIAQSGYQTAIMAPTEILAIQHYETFSKTMETLSISCALLVGGTTAKQKKSIKEKIANGEITIVIGTHALLQENVEFKNLGLVVTDEQHRFGVTQRDILAQKGSNPHKLVMSATPIPRTLALIIYGDLDVSVIGSSPKGRLPIKTYLITSKERDRAYKFIEKHVTEGRQAYIVCPLIEEADGEKPQNEKNAVTTYAIELQKSLPKSIRTAVLHGKMKPAEKEKIMLDFKENRTDVLVSTTVIEVGVDVPNAVIMMIENAENFGLSQLHQLRGRVGRGEYQSFCILVSDNSSEKTLDRLKIMTHSTDGFYISEQDLKQRGPGDFFGEKQHGLPDLKIANMMDDIAVLKHTQALANRILHEDPNLESSENAALKDMVQKLFDSKKVD